MNATLPDVVSYILSEADEVDLTRLQGAIRDRHKTLRAIAAAKVAVGMKVTIQEISPKYLNGMTGTVTALTSSGTRCTITLDEDSTSMLRYSGTRFFVAPGLTTYPLTGIPTSCARAA